MSNKYPQWNLSNFPEYIDTQKVWSDMTAEEKPYADQYFALIATGDFVGANTLLSTRPNLQKMIISALDLNTLQHQILAVQAFYFDDVREHVISIIVNRGDWSASTSDYVFGNIVTYVVNSVALDFELMVANCPAGTLPTNQAYWRPLQLQGKQGVGIGLTPAGTWVGTQTYVINNAVSHKNILWRALVDNLDSEPSSANTDWEKVMELTSDANIMSDEHTGLHYELVIRSGKLYKRPTTTSFATSYAALEDEDIPGNVYKLYVLNGRLRKRRIS